MGAGGVSAARVVVVAADALERGCLVYWNGRCAILVLAIGVLDGRAEGGEAVRSAWSVGGVWLWGGEVTGTDDVGRHDGRRGRRRVHRARRREWRHLIAVGRHVTLSIMPRATTREHGEQLLVVGNVELIPHSGHKAGVHTTGGRQAHKETPRGARGPSDVSHSRRLTQLSSAQTMLPRRC